MRSRSILVAAVLLAAPLALRAQQAASDAASAPRPLDHTVGAAQNVDIITPHITDAHVLEYPCFDKRHGFTCEYELPRWSPVHIGPLALDLSITKHVFMLLVAAFLCCVTLIPAAVIHGRQHGESGAPKGFATMIETMVLYIRNEVIIPNVGPHGNGYVPYLLTIFFFVLFANLLGLIPYGSTATGNISVTATLAITAFVVIETAGMRSQGWGYIRTIVYWPSEEMAVWGKVALSLILTPIEIIGKFTKPFALSIRLFANMTAGHVMVLALISLIFVFGSALVGLAPLAMAIGIMVLELFVAFLQAYVFTILVAAFIGQIREAHH